MRIIVDELVKAGEYRIISVSDDKFVLRKANRKLGYSLNTIRRRGVKRNNIDGLVKLIQLKDEDDLFNASNPSAILR